MKKIFAIGLSLSLISISTVGCSSKEEVEVIKIATQTSLSGSIATEVEAIKNGAQMAVDDNKDKFKDLGFDLQLAPYDDQSDYKKREANAQEIGADQSILAVVGHSAPVQEYNLAMVYIHDGFVNRSESSNKSVHSILARPEVQNIADANFATNKLNAKTIFIIDDDKHYSTWNNSSFKEQAGKNGATIETTLKTITSGGKDNSELLDEVVEAKPDLIFFGGLF
jgi:branched-chain amino acid transport system substrate-binding protein